MTPERRQFVTTLISKIGSSLCCDQPDSIALAELGTAMCDLVEDYDSLTADIDRLKGEVERLQMIALCGDKSHLLVIRERDTLRTRLDALVTAAQNLGATRNDGYPVYDRVSPFMMDALAAAVAEAKGKE